MTFLVRFVATIIEEKRPSGFPKKVFTDINIGTEDRNELKKAINDFLALLVHQRGMVVEKSKDFDSYDELKPDFKDLDNRVFVPYHMFAYIETVTKTISAKTHVVGPEGSGEEDEPIPSPQLQ